MIVLLTCLILASPSQGDVDRKLETDWNVHISNLRVPDPTRPNLEPNLGYTGLWRSIYGTRREENPSVGGLADSAFYIDSEELSARSRREPRIRSARWITISQQFYNQPSFSVPAASLDRHTASFVWNHQLEQADTPWQSSYTMAPTSSPRDYVPNTIVQEEEEDWTHEAKQANLLMTIAIAVLASVLLVVIVFMPK